MDNFLNTDISNVINDLKNIFTEEEDFKKFADVMKESLGEFLMELYTSSEENLTTENMLDRIKEIVVRRFDEI